MKCMIHKYHIILLLRLQQILENYKRQNLYELCIRNVYL